jgi:hypothetical protein
MSIQRVNTPYPNLRRGPSGGHPRARRDDLGGLAATSQPEASGVLRCAQIATKRVGER